MSNFFRRGVLYRSMLLLIVILLGGCQLSVSTQGGRGTVTSQSGLINCGTSGSTCTVDYSDYAGSKTSYTEYLYAHADRGYRFSHWTGDCSGSGACSVKLSKTSGDKSVTAVFVEEPLSEEKELLSFKFLKADNPFLPSDVTAVIDSASKNVNLAVPTGTNLQSLVAYFETSGVDVRVAGASQQSSVTTNDYSEPVFYQVIAEDDSKQGYMVSVSEVDYQAKALSNFKFSIQDNTGFEQDSIGQIDQQNHLIQLLVAQGTDVSSLIARFETSGQTVTVNGVEQYSGVTANNYISDVTYRVTAYDNSTQDYLVRVSESNCLEQPWQGNFTITSTQDIETIAGYTSVTGSLTIGSTTLASTGLTSLDGLECLNTLGSLSVVANPDLTNLDGLSGVTTITGNLGIHNNDALSSISGLSNLTSVSNVSLSNNAVLSNLSGLDNIQQVSDLDLYNASALTDVSAIAGINVTGKLKFRNLTELTSLPGFNGFTNPIWLEIIGNNKLVSLAGLENITQATVVNISQNGALLNLTGLSGLTSANSFGLVANGNLQSLVGAEALTTLTTLTITDHSNLLSLDGLSGLNTISSGLTLDNNTQLMDLSGLSNLANISGNVTIRGNANLTDFTGFDAVSTGVSTLTIDNNDGLQSLQGLASIPSATRVIVKNNDQLASLQGLNGLTSTSLLQIENNVSLLDLSGLESLTRVNGRVALLNNDGMSNTQGASALEVITGDFDIERNNRLTHIDGFEQLTTVGATSIRLNNELVNLDGFLSVTAINGSLDVNGNTRLLDLLGMSNVVTIGTNATHDVNIRGGALDHLALQSLKTVTGDLLVDNTSLMDLDLPQLCTVGQNFQITNNGALCTQKAEAIRDQVVNCNGIGGAVTISSNMVCN